MMEADMKVGNYYRLNKKMEHEHQDHWFTYPAGLIVRLNNISREEDLYSHWIETEDGPMQHYGSNGFFNVYHFDIVDGSCYVFDPKELEPASKEDWDNCRIEVLIEPMRW